MSLIKEDIVSTSGRLFRRLVSINALMILLEMFGHNLNGSSWNLVFFIHSMSLFLAPLFFTQWLCYMDYHMFVSYNRLRIKGFYLQVMVISGMVTLANWLGRWIFDVNLAGEYVRGPFSFIEFFICSSMIIFAWHFVRMYADLVDQEMLLSMIVMSVLPLIAMMGQVMFGILIFWPVITIVLVITYILMDMMSTSKDFLTGLLSRQRLDSYLDYMIGAKKEFGLIMVNINGFRVINDTYGHKYADFGLIAFGNALRAAVPKAKVVGRYDGDEFVIITSPKEEAVYHLYREKIKFHLDRECASLDIPYEITFGMGYHNWTVEKNYSYGSIVTLAEMMMYKDKKRVHQEGFGDVEPEVVDFKIEYEV